MSNYNIKAKNKDTGEIENITAIDLGYSGYEYMTESEVVYTETVFNELYEELEVEMPDKPVQDPTVLENAKRLELWGARRYRDAVQRLIDGHKEDKDYVEDMKFIREVNEE